MKEVNKFSYAYILIGFVSSIIVSVFEGYPQIWFFIPVIIGCSVCVILIQIIYHVDKKQKERDMNKKYGLLNYYLKEVKKNE